MEVEDSAADNGYLLNSYFLPEEVLVHILSFVSPYCLVHRCRYVCKAWRDMISDNEVWKLKILRSSIPSLSKYSTNERKQLTVNFPWYLHYWILRCASFEQNLLKNNCGQLKLRYWTVTEPPREHPLGSGYWNVEPVPIYSDPLPKSENDFGSNESCFSTSYVTCTKHQIIDLRKKGFRSTLLDEFQPSIIVSEWFAGRYDCGCRYKLRISLKNENRENIIPVELVERQRRQWEGQEWNKVSLKFENYGPGLRFIVFEHEGSDTHFWGGNYGSKMAGGVVKICFPKILQSAEE